MSKVCIILLTALLVPFLLQAQITKPGYQAPAKNTAPTYNGPKKFEGKSKIIVEIDYAGTLEVDYEKIYDFKKGDVWKSDIPAGQHKIELSNGSDTWSKSIETKSGQQLIVVTELQNTISARQAEAARKVEATRQAEATRKAEAARKVEATRQAEATRKAEAARKGSFRDSRDGQVYSTIKIGNQVWMSENLNYTTTDSWCYDNASYNCEKYGRLYRWEAAKKGCPTGWHLPTDAEWNTLVNNNGGESKAGANLKEGGSSGFNASLGGYRRTDGEVQGVGGIGSYWSSSASGEDYAWERNFYSGNDEVGRYVSTRGNGQSVRCLQD